MRFAQALEADMGGLVPGAGVEAIRARIAAGKPAYRDPLERLAAQPGSMRRAVDAKCWDCQGRDSDAGVKWRIGNCEVGEACPLYLFRPYQRLLGTEMPAALRVEA